MAYDEALAARTRKMMMRRKKAVEKKMFGGVAFLLAGNMCVGIWKDSLIVRVGREAYEEALGEPFVTKFAVTGRPMTGWVMVDPGGLEGDDDLKVWIERAAKFVRTLPEKG